MIVTIPWATAWSASKTKPLSSKLSKNKASLWPSTNPRERTSWEKCSTLFSSKTSLNLTTLRKVSEAFLVPSVELSQFLRSLLKRATFTSFATAVKMLKTESPVPEALRKHAKRWTEKSCPAPTRQFMSMAPWTRKSEFRPSKKSPTDSKFPRGDATCTWEASPPTLKRMTWSSSSDLMVKSSPSELLLPSSKFKTLQVSLLFASRLLTVQALLKLPTLLWATNHCTSTSTRSRSKYLKISTSSFNSSQSNWFGLSCLWSLPYQELDYSLYFLDNIEIIW